MAKKKTTASKKKKPARAAAAKKALAVKRSAPVKAKKVVPASSRKKTAARTATGMAGLAARAGYSDQSHLTREFVRFAGLPPTAWVAAELANIQDGGHTR